MAMVMVMKSWWTSRPRSSVIAFMVWLLVRIHVMKQNVGPAPGEGVLAALPTRVTRVLRSGNHTGFFNILGEQAARAVRREV